MDETDRELLNALQVNFPLRREPFSEMGARLGLDEASTIWRIKRLKEEGIIRIIGPVFNARSLGYQSTLVAMRLAEERVNTAAQVISEHPGISHAYVRDNVFNLWFTISLPGDSDLEKELRTLKGWLNPDEMLNLPALRIFKIGAYFDMVGRGISPDAPASVGPQHAMPLEPIEHDVINELQQDLPLDRHPFDVMAGQVGLGVKGFLTRCRRLQERGIMKRFGASIKHHNAGFVANAMVCWSVSPSMVLEAGKKMASFREVSHCHERRMDKRWPYNLFAMIHGKGREDCLDSVKRISLETGLRGYEALFSIKEFKKERVKYQA